MDKKRTLVTAALPYANGPVHVGHLAGCYLPADIYVRYLRAKRKEVLFVCGSDEHGVAITIKARKEGITPQQVVDKYHHIIKTSFKEFGIDFDVYSRTSAPVHHQTSQEFFRKLYDKGIFKEIETEQYYDEEASQFLADRYIMGTCPVCSNPNAYGDQCESCGTSLDPKDLKDPRSTLSGGKPVLKKSRNWFLDLGELAEKPEFIEYKKRIEDWKPNVKGQFNSWLNQGLHPRAMTRDLDWGVKVPIDGVEGKVLYVWFDAPIGYISATKDLYNEKGDTQGWEKWWKDKETSLVHFIGKDNIVFHSLIFPMMLLEHGGFIVPDNVPANEFLNLEGQKISTSRNWAIWLNEYLLDFPGRTDELRYTLTSISPETKDADFTWKDYQLKVNSELVAILGNFVNRAIVLTHKFYNGVVPEPNLSEADFAASHPTLAFATRTLNEETQRAFAAMEAALREYKFREAQAEMMNIARAGNKYMGETEPWKLVKQDPTATELVLKHCLDTCLKLAEVAKPFLPGTSHKIKQQLNVENEVNEYTIDVAMRAGHVLNPAFHLFKNIEDAEVDAQLVKLEANRPKDTTTGAADSPSRGPGGEQGNNSLLPKGGIKPRKPEIVYDDFAKMDIRVGTVLEAERVPKTDKLMKLTIDTGLDVRTVVSGIAHCFEPEQVKGRQVCILINLAPRKLKGIDSQGMILMAEDVDGKLKFLSPAEGVMNGSVVA
ncbi:MAG TPA: methionine--tRNA ligase [Bacteroidia bacterium]|nr:methionine--tRNA ligase [Bacteroidia bacterium]